MFLPLFALAAEGSMSDKVVLWGGFLLLVVEFLIGEAKVIEANSTIKMGINAVKAILKMLGPKA